MSGDNMRLGPNAFGTTCDTAKFHKTAKAGKPAVKNLIIFTYLGKSVSREDWTVANRPVCYLGEFWPRKCPKIGKF